MARLTSVKFVCYLSMLLLCACQSLEPVYQSTVIHKKESLYLDHSFKGYEQQTVEAVHTIFALDDHIKKKLHTQISIYDDNENKISSLIRFIFDHQAVAINYQSHANTIAVDTFYRQQANCISLTILAYALAKELNLTVNFQDVDVPEYWLRNGRYNLLTGHVNLRIAIKPLLENHDIFDRKSKVVDFDPYINKQQFISHSISKNTVIAMFYTNKAAQAIVDKNYIKAYAYLKQATLVDDNYSEAWGNLGVLYRLSQQNEVALKTYQYAIQLNNKNLSAMTNLAILLKAKGQNTQAKKIEQRIHRMRLPNAYYHALLARNAVTQENYQSALNHFKKALKLRPNQHEFYYGQAQVYLKLGDTAQAEKYLTLAIKYNPFEYLEVSYVAKLSMLRAVLSDNQQTN